MDFFRKSLKKFWSKIHKDPEDLTSKIQPINKFEQILISSSPEEYKKAAVDYPTKLRPCDLYYLYTKPFDCSKDKSTSREHFTNFAHLLEILSLPPRTKILDVACGPGWLCEFLARSGYNVTGIDISSDLIQIAKERIEAIKFGPEEGKPPEVRFLAQYLKQLNREENFL
ncbi:MAG: class I SAM-dependent methyltransferase [Candidatus Aminicenantaceae bacterium]